MCQLVVVVLRGLELSIAGEHAVICDTECAQSLETVEKVTTESGLEYQDIKLGKGPSPDAGFQVTINTVGYNLDGVVFDR